MSLTSGMFNAKNRFGFHVDFLKSVSPQYASRDKADCYIPTRLEVFQMRAEELQPILLHWFRNAPEPLIPSAAQKQTVLELLHMRKDRAQLTALIRQLENAPD